MCWPRTRIGSVAVQPCFGEFRGLRYDISREYIQHFFFHFYYPFLWFNSMCVLSCGEWECMYERFGYTLRDVVICIRKRGAYEKV